MAYDGATSGPVRRNRHATKTAKRNTYTQPVSEAFALRALAHPPVDRLGELQAILSQLPLCEAPDFESLALHLDMEAGDSSDATKLRALLVWSAASDLIAARPPNALNVIQGGKRAIYLGWSITLDHTASWTY